MKLSEKIQLLRKENGYSQEELAEMCGVSRQAISKWEADVALPETDKIILLSRIFQITIDVLLKDELSVNGVKEVHCCGENVIREEHPAVYEGILIKESIDDETVLDYLNINKVEIWKTDGVPRYWTALFFTSKQADFPQIISRAVISNEKSGGNWFVDFKAGNVKYIVFRNKILKYIIGNQKQKDEVCEACRQLGIPDAQMHWPE